MSTADDNTSAHGGVDSTRPRLNYLLERLCDQLTTDDELAEFNALLGQSKLNREHYLRYISVHTSLHLGAGVVDEGVAAACSERSATSSGAHVARACATAADSHGRSGLFPRRLAGRVAVAATLLGVLWGGIGFWNWPAHQTRGSARAQVDVYDDSDADPATGAPVAQVTRLSADLVWRNPNESIALMSRVRAGQPLRLLHGEVQLTYQSGVELRLLAPAEFVVQAEGGDLRRGGVRAVVPEHGRGFTIGTPNGKVVDLGTEFGVAVDDFGVSEVSVFQGIVDAFPFFGKGDPSQTIRLTEGEAMQWNGETYIRLKADPWRFGDSDRDSPIRTELPAGDLVVDEEFERGSLDADQWKSLGEVSVEGGALELRGAEQLPYLVTAHEFAPTDAPITVVCDIRFTHIVPRRPPSFAVLTRSADERDVDAPDNWRTMHTCVRCSFKSLDASAAGVVEAATKLDRSCPLTNILWSGFDRLEEDTPYRVVMTDDGMNVSFTVSLRDDPSINKTVTCRSLFRGKENFIALEGPSAGAVSVDRIQIFQDKSARAAPEDARLARGASRSLPRLSGRAIEQRLDAMARGAGDLVIRDDFNTGELDLGTWTTLDDVRVIDGRVRLGAPNAEQHINTWTNRPYLLTRGSYAPVEGSLTVVGAIEFAENFLNEYGGSFAVMTRADNRHGSGPGWEYSILRFGVRANFWPAAWGQEHSLEIHEKPSPSTLSLLLAEELEINPEMRHYLFKVVDDGQRVTLTIRDAVDGTIHKTVSAPINPALRSGFVGFEGCWGCPVWLDNVRVYRELPAAE